MSLELEDRFGPAPQPVLNLLLEVRLGFLCRSFSVLKLEIGPAALALTTASDPAAELLAALAPLGARRSGDRILLPRPTTCEAERLDLMGAVAEVLARAAQA
jgi:transcription-repair coupling factor (superfamily II helicase)